VLNVQISPPPCVPLTARLWSRTEIIAGNIINFSREPVRRNEFIIGVARLRYRSGEKILTDIINRMIVFLKIVK
jgi:hypothetical protein